MKTTAIKQLIKELFKKKNCCEYIKNVIHFQTLKSFLSQAHKNLFYIYLKWSSLGKSDLTKKLRFIIMNIIFHTEI